MAQPETLSRKNFITLAYPKERNFAREIANTARYKEIKRVLDDKLSQPYIAFAIYVAEWLEDFLVRFQSSQPLIHRLYESIGRLMFDVMSNFIKKERLVENEHRLEANQLGLLNVRGENMPKSIHDINTGTKTRHLLAQL